MKLYISETIRNRRKLLGLTQEQLAAEIGVTTQAVSKWERDEGYPDILTLPILANFFHITIDELLGQNELIRERERQLLWDNEIRKELQGISTGESETNAFLTRAKEYLRKYPDDWMTIVNVLDRIHRDLTAQEQKEHLSWMAVHGQRLLERCPDNSLRQEAIKHMVVCASEEMLSDWERLSPTNYEGVISELSEKRLENQGKTADLRRVHFINRLALMRHLIVRSLGPLGQENGADLCYRGNIALIECFGENGKIPNGWLALYAMLLRYHADALIDGGNLEEGLAVLERAIEPSKAAKEVYTEGSVLSFGREEFFGGILVRLERRGDKYPELLPVWEGGEGNVYETGCRSWRFCPYQNPVSIALKRSKKLAVMREDPRFLAVMEKALTCGV